MECCGALLVGNEPCYFFRVLLQGPFFAVLGWGCPTDAIRVSVNVSPPVHRCSASSVCCVLLRQFPCQRVPCVVCNAVVSLLRMQPDLKARTAVLGTEVPPQLVAVLVCCVGCLSCRCFQLAAGDLWSACCSLFGVGTVYLDLNTLPACNALCTVDVTSRQAQQPFMVVCLHVSHGCVGRGVLPRFVVCFQGHRQPRSSCVACGAQGSCVCLAAAVDIISAAAVSAAACFCATWWWTLGSHSRAAAQLWIVCACSCTWAAVWALVSKRGYFVLVQGHRRLS